MTAPVWFALPPELHPALLAVARGAKVNALLDVAQANMGEAAGTYVAADVAAASGYTGF